MKHVGELDATWRDDLTTVSSRNTVAVDGLTWARLLLGTGQEQRYVSRIGFVVRRSSSEINHLKAYLVTVIKIYEGTDALVKDADWSIGDLLSQ